MYPVSELYKSKIERDGRILDIKIIIDHHEGSIELTNDDLSMGSLTYNSSTQSGENFTIGGTVASDLSFAIMQNYSNLVYNSNEEVNMSNQEVIPTTAEGDFDVVDEWGRNLLRNSNFNSGSEYWDGSFIITDEGALLESVAGRADYIQNTTLIPEGEYVVQIRYRVVEGQAPYLYVTNGTDMRLPQGSYIFEIGDNEWQTVTFQVIVNSESRFYAIRYAAGSPVDHLEGKTLIEWIKLEKGSTATSWTPAPEDITETNIINHNTPFVKNNTIHSLKLYNRALTDEEIMQNYQAGQCSPLLAMRGD